jgi:hypothetical protein
MVGGSKLNEKVGQNYLTINKNKDVRTIESIKRKQD